MNTQPEILPHKQDMQEMIGEMFSDFNRWVTGVEVGHNPSRNECAEHYIRCGGRDNFRSRHPVFVVTMSA